MELGARPDVLRHRDRSAQFARDHRRVHPVPAQEDLSGHCPFEQGARRAHPGKVGEGFAEGVLEQFHDECRRWRHISVRSLLSSLGLMDPFWQGLSVTSCVARSKRLIKTYLKIDHG